MLFLKSLFYSYHFWTFLLAFFSFRPASLLHVRFRNGHPLPDLTFLNERIGMLLLDGPAAAPTGCGLRSAGLRIRPHKNRTD